MMIDIITIHESQEMNQAAIDYDYEYCIQCCSLFFHDDWKTAHAPVCGVCIGVDLDDNKKMFNGWLNDGIYL